MKREYPFRRTKHAILTRNFLYAITEPHGVTAQKPHKSLDFTAVCHFVPCNVISALENPGVEYWKTFGLTLRGKLCRILGPTSSERGTAAAQWLRCHATNR